MKYINANIEISEDQHKNSHALNTYKQGIMCMNPAMIEGALHDNGVFHGRCKLAQVAWLREIFHGIVGNMISFHVNQGISIFPFSGSEVTELRIQSVNNMEEYGSNCVAFGTPPMDNERVLTFTAEFREGKIFRLIKTKKSIPAEMVVTFEKQN